MQKSTSLSAPKADTISTVQNWLNTENRCVLNAKKISFVLQNKLFSPSLQCVTFESRRVMSANACGLFLCPSFYDIILVLGISYWFRPVWSVNAPTASIQGVTQRGAEPLLFPQSLIY